MNLHMISEFEDSGLFVDHCVRTGHSSGNIPSHSHSFYEILLLKKGNATYYMDDKAFPASKNTLIFTRPYQSHRIQLNTDEPYDRYDLLINPDTFPMLAKIPPSVHVLHFDGNPIVTGLFEKIDYYCRSLSRDTLQQLLAALCEEILINILIAADEIPSPAMPYHYPLTEKAIALMEQTLTSLDSMDALCSRLGVSKSYFYRIFQADMGVTPKAYLTQRRLMLARREIFLGAKATTIYSQYGFTDYSAFYRAYKKQFGYPPAETQDLAFREDS